MWVVEGVTENQGRAEQAPLLPIRPLPHIQHHNAVMSITPPWNSGLRGLSPSPPAAASQASCSFAHPAPQSTTSLGLPATAPLSHRESSPPWLPVSAPPIGLGECFFFISLVVRLPYSSIFCQFWLFFVFKLLLLFFWLCEEAQCIYLWPHLGQKSPNISSSY